MVRVVHLVPPAKRDKYIGFNVGIRPVRLNGPRLEREVIGSKTIYHNYGHGGAGVCLSYGSSRFIVNKFILERKIDDPMDVAVLGSGYMGLLTALLLLKAGFKVTIYTKTLPSEFGVFNDSPDKLTSQIAPGFWLPLFEPYLINKAIAQVMFEDTYHFFKTSFEKKKYAGIHSRDLYEVNPGPDWWKDKVPNIIPEFEEVDIDFGKGKLVRAFRTTVYQIDGDTMLNDILSEIKSLGGQVFKKNFEDLGQISALPQSVIFNCTGYQSRYLFNDKNVVPLKGILAAIERVPGCDYFFACDLPGKKHFDLYPNNKRTSIGRIKEECEENAEQDQQLVQDLLGRLDTFFELFVEP